MCRIQNYTQAASAVNGVRRHATRFQHRVDPKSGRLERRFSLAPSMSQVLPTTSRVVLHSKVRQMRALSLGVPFGQWADRFDAARCCTSEEASLSAQAVCLCCPVKTPPLPKPMLTRIECPSWLLCWSVGISQCVKACSVILPTWCRKNGQFRFSDADPSCLVRSWWRVCASASPTNIIRWSVWPKCSCGCSEAPREHSFRVPLACKVGALEQVEPLSGICDIVLSWFLNVFCGCVIPRVGCLRLD